MNPNQTAQNLRRKFSLIAQKNSVPYTNENGEFDETWKEKFGGSSKEIKILNVVQNGSLYRSDGTKFTNFSGSNYLTIGGVVQNGIFSQTQNVLHFGDFFASADSWEINGSFKFEDTTLNEYETFFTGSADKTGVYLQYLGNTSQISIDYAINGNWITRVISDTLTKGSKYYFRIVFNGEDYKFYLNTDGQTYDNTTLKDTYINAVKITDTDYCEIGRNGTTSSRNPAVHCEIDIADWNIKKNGEIWLKGVEIL